MCCAIHISNKVLCDAKLWQRDPRRESFSSYIRRNIYLFSFHFSAPGPSDMSWSAVGLPLTLERLQTLRGEVSPQWVTYVFLHVTSRLHRKYSWAWTFKAARREKWPNDFGRDIFLWLFCTLNTFLTDIMQNQHIDVKNKALRCVEFTSSCEKVNTYQLFHESIMGKRMARGNCFLPLGKSGL